MAVATDKKRPPEGRTGFAASEYPSDEALRAYYAQGWESMWLRHMDAELRPRHASYRRRMEATFKALGLPRDRPVRVLDIGCGIGIYAINLAKRWPQAQVLGVDLSRVQVELAHQLASQHHVPDRCRFVVGDANDVSSAKPFEYIVCTELLEHLPDPGRALDNLKAMATRDSVYVFSVPQLYHGRCQSGVFYKQLLPDGGEVHTQDRANLVEGVAVCEYYHAAYTVREFSELLEKAGYRVERVLGTDFQSPLRTVRACSPHFGRARVRGHNALARAVNVVAAHLPRTIDLLLNRVLSHGWAGTLVVRCHLA